MTPLSRACGSISYFPQMFGLAPFSFPRVREYFLRAIWNRSRWPLFPARAGVFPSMGKRLPPNAPLSRACGSISRIPAPSALTRISFPRVREYFHLRVQLVRSHKLFPARAGVFPYAQQAHSGVGALSRACGSISFHTLGNIDELYSFPRVREYFLGSSRGADLPALFPARAGVFPYEAIWRPTVISLSRACGSISSKPSNTVGSFTSFPRVREYFPTFTLPPTPCLLFPARAGVFP